VAGAQSGAGSAGRASTTVLFAATLLAFVAVGAALPALSPYVRGPLHSSDLAAGIVVGCYAATSVVARPFAGRFADRRGRRIVFIVGAALMSVGGLLYLVAGNVPELVLGRLIAGAGEGALYTAAATWTVDAARGGREGLALGRFGVAVWAGLALGPAVGALLRSAAGYDAVWILTATLPLAAVALTWPLAEPAPELHTDPVPHPLVPRATWIPGSALLLGNIGYGALAGFVVLFLSSQGIGGGAVVFTAFAAAVVLSRLMLGHVPDRIGPRRGGTLAAAIEAAGFMIIALSGSLASRVVGAAVVGIGFSLLFPSLALLVVNAVPDSGRGAAMGAFSAFFDAGVGIGAPLAGVVATTSGYAAVFVMAAAASALGALLTALRGYSGRRLPRTL